MPRLKTVTRTTTTLYVGENEDIELELEHEPNSGDEPEVAELEQGGWVVGYLVRDDDCANPLDDCDGMGKILDGRRGYKTSAEYWERRENLGPMDVFLDVYSHGGDAWRINGGGRYFPDEQWDVSNGAGIWYPDEACKQRIEMIATEELLAPNEWHKVRREWVLSNLVQKPPLPDKTPGVLNIVQKMHSAPTGETYPHTGNPVSRYWYTYGFEIKGGKSRNGYRSILGAAKGAAKAMGVEFDLAKYKEECRKEAVVCAHQAVETYNGWLSGDCWGVCVETFDAEGEPLEQDACWGYHGQKYAEEEMKSNVAHAVKAANKPADGQE